jgi:GTP cyclohydrolase I
MSTSTIADDRVVELGTEQKLTIGVVETAGHQPSGPTITSAARVGGLALHGLDLGDEFLAAEQLHERQVTEEQLRKFEGYAAEIFTAFGLDLNTPSTRDTPRRFIRAMFDVTAGYDGDPKLVTAFETECRGEPDCRLSQVIEGPIEFFSLCEHHALPFFGQAYVGYIAGERILGISKLTRVVRLFSQRFSVQERLGQQIVDALEAILQPNGVAVYLEGHHLCTQMRGVRAVSPMTRTTYWRGEYAHNADLRSEFFVACGLHR